MTHSRPLVYIPQIERQAPPHSANSEHSNEPIPIVDIVSWGSSFFALYVVVALLNAVVIYAVSSRAFVFVYNTI
jgi:hypothetical protein